MHESLRASVPGTCPVRNVIERALIVCEGRTIRKSDLPDDFRAANGARRRLHQDSARTSLDDVEKEMISAPSSSPPATRLARGILGVSAKTLYNNSNASAPNARLTRNDRNARRARKPCVWSKTALMASCDARSHDHAQHHLDRFENRQHDRRMSRSATS